MNNLSTEVKPQALDSREVAEMIGKEHNKLLRDIRTYIEQLGEAKIGHTDFFAESTYTTDQNKTMPCYTVTRKGCEFIANKLTGVKGTEFTAKYINRFHNMEETIQTGIVQALTPELQMIKGLFDNAVSEREARLKQAEEIEKIKQEVGVIKEQIAPKQIKIAPVQTELTIETEIFNKTLKKERISTEQIATMYSLSSMAFYDALSKLGFVVPGTRRGWLLHPQYENKGIGFSERAWSEYPIVTWSEKGVKLIRDTLKNNGVSPTKRLPQKKKRLMHKKG